MTSLLVYNAYSVANSLFDTKFGLLTRQTILTKPPKPTISVRSSRPSGYAKSNRHTRPFWPNAPYVKLFQFFKANQGEVLTKRTINSFKGVFSVVRMTSNFILQSPAHCKLCCALHQLSRHKFQTHWQQRKSAGW